MGVDVTPQEQHEIIVAGAKAKRSGWAVKNPYPNETPKYRLWHSGWLRPGMYIATSARPEAPDDRRERLSYEQNPTAFWLRPDRDEHDMPCWMIEEPYQKTTSYYDAVTDQTITTVHSAMF